MHGVRLVVAYDGSDFAGWQRQPGQRTVQGELERAIGEITGSQVDLRGTGRTDAGVHAQGQVAAFDTERELEPFAWPRAINGKLAHDVSVRSAETCEVGYNPRFDATDKTYRYLFHVAATRDPLLRDRAWEIDQRRARPYRGARESMRDWLDIDEMQRAAQVIVGEHDFAAFRSSADTRSNTVRTIHEARVFAIDDELLAFEIRGIAFLHNMVRILAGTLLEVGRERISVADLQAILQAKGARDQAGETAPAGGLYLMRVSLGRRQAAELDDTAADLGD